MWCFDCRFTPYFCPVWHCPGRHPLLGGARRWSPCLCISHAVVGVRVEFVVSATLHVLSRAGRRPRIVRIRRRRICGLRILQGLACRGRSSRQRAFLCGRPLQSRQQVDRHAHFSRFRASRSADCVSLGFLRSVHFLLLWRLCCCLYAVSQKRCSYEAKVLASPRVLSCLLQ